MYKDIDLNRDSQLVYDEIRAYVIAENPGMTDAEIDADSEKLFTMLNRNDDEHVDNKEGWGGYLAENYERREVYDPESEREGFEASWNYVDTNRDQLISEAEAKAAPFDHLELFGLLEPAVNDNNEIEFELAVDYWMKVVAPNQRLSEQLWEEALSPGSIGDFWKE